MTFDFEPDLRPVSDDDLNLALHAANAGANKEFPFSARFPFMTMEQAATACKMPQDIVNRAMTGLLHKDLLMVDANGKIGFNLDDPAQRAIYAMGCTTFNDNDKREAIVNRAWAVLADTEKPVFSKWVQKDRSGDFARYAWATVLIRVAAYYPLDKQTGNFEKGFVREVRRMETMKRGR